MFSLIELAWSERRFEAFLAVGAMPLACPNSDLTRFSMRRLSLGHVLQNRKIIEHLKIAVFNVKFKKVRNFDKTL